MKIEPTLITHGRTHNYAVRRWTIFGYHLTGCPINSLCGRDSPVPVNSLAIEAGDLRPYTAEHFHVLADYLDGTRHEGECPRFADIHLVDLYKITPLIYIFDISHTDGKWDVRFFGSQLVEAYGRDLTGEEGHDIIRPTPNSAQVIEAMNVMIAEQRPLWTINTAESAYRAHRGDTKMVTYERLAFPLLGKGDSVDHVIGILSMCPSIADQPFETRLLDWIPRSQP